MLGSPGRVTSLVLTSEGLTGTIPPDLGRLDGLEHLWLNYNQLTGEIPAALGSLGNLLDLQLGNNQFDRLHPARSPGRQRPRQPRASGLRNTVASVGAADIVPDSW